LGYSCEDRITAVLCDTTTDATSAFEYSDEGDRYCRLCAAGHACSTIIVETSCSDPDCDLLCSSGNSCAITATKTPCDVGYYSALGESACTICPAGNYCKRDFGKPIKCHSGTFQVDEGKDFCNSCSWGYYSEPESTACTQCPADEYFNILSIDLILTRFCPSPEIPRNPCLVGNHAVLGSSHCEFCQGSDCGNCEDGKSLLNYKFMK
jgi:hypothetical protein